MTIDWRRRALRVEVPAGVDDAWVWALAMPYRCLSDPEGALVMPASSESIPDEYANWERRHRQQLAYYTALQSFLTYSFGWTRHDKGLLWWYEQGWPTDDQRLALIKDIWFYDHTLTGYLAWVFARMESSPEESLTPLKTWAIKPDLVPLHPPEKWAGKLRAALEEGVWTGGSDPMHLWGGYHAGAPSGRRIFGEQEESVTPARLIGINTELRSVTFVADSIDGWYARLAGLGRDLPSLPGHASWHVDVFVKPIGFLGTYRRSHVTGLWFAGQHRYHTVGN